MTDMFLVAVRIPDCVETAFVAPVVSAMGGAIGIMYRAGQARERKMEQWFEELLARAGERK